MAQSFNCPSCGAPLDVTKDSDATMRCPYCNASVIVPETMRGNQAAVDFSSIPGAANTIAQAKELGEVARLARSNQKIEAIKLYRQITGASLLDAKNSVEAIERGEVIQLTSTVTHAAVQSGGIEPAEAEAASSNDPPKDMAQVALLARSSKKIEAIKLYRQITGASLVDAKVVVEALERGEPVRVSYATIPAATAQPTRPQPAYLAPTAQVKRQTSPGLLIAVLIILVLGLIFGINLIQQLPKLAIPDAAQPNNTGQAGVFTKAAATIKTEAVALLEPTRSYGDATLLLSFGAEGMGQGQLQDARLIAVDPDGAIYAANYQGGRVECFDPEGKFVNQWNTSDSKSPLLGLAVNRQEVVSVAQAGDLLLFNGQTGEPVKQIKDGGTGVRVSHLFPTSDGGYALITAGEDLWLFDAQGKQTLRLASAISKITDKSELDTHAAVDGEGTIYLLGHFNNAVFKYSPAGKYLNQFGSSGDQPGQFRAPEDVAVDGQGRVYISDIKGVQIFNRDGRYLGLIKVSGAAFGMAVDNQDALYVITNHPAIYKFKVTVKP